MRRRDWILISMAAATGARAGDAWKRNPASWSSKDVEAILNRSPWAKTAKVEFQVGDIAKGPPPGSVAPPPPSGVGGPAGGGGGSGNRGDSSGNPIGGAPVGRGGIPAEAADLPKFQAVVRWESAAPIRRARKLDDDAKTGGLYIISVSGFPMMPKRADAGDSDVDIKDYTLLERQGKPPLRPSKVETLPGGVLEFTFDGASNPITESDSDVVFVTGTGSLGLKVKFHPRDMMFEGKLAL